VKSDLSLSFKYGKNIIYYNLLRARRKTLEIAVLPDCSIEVKAPLGAEIEQIELRLKKRGLWILRQREYFGQFVPKTREKHYLSGETHLYLGRRYRLKVTFGENDDVKLRAGVFTVTCKDPADSKVVKKLMSSWYLFHGRVRFQESLDRCWLPFERMGFDKPHITIRKMSKRWGSLSTKGFIILNRELIKAPQECIDYVVIHELCHLKFPEHSKAFYKLLEQTLPQWKGIKHKLELSLC
jgi:hypothetical protein